MYSFAHVGHDGLKPGLLGPQAPLALPQGCRGELLLEHRRRLVGAHAEEQMVFFAGKVWLLRTGDPYAVLSVVYDAADGQAYRPTP